MDNSNVMPINHNFGTATVTTAAETGKGGVKGALRGGLWTAGILGALGIGAMFFGPVGIGLGIISLLAAIPAGVYVGGIGATLGAAGGAYHGLNRVSKEQGAANVMQAQVAAYQAQAVATATENKYGFAAPGSQFNQAGSTVSAMQSEGRMDGAQLQRA